MAKRIAVDIDGVLYNYSKTACFLLNEYKGYNLNWEETDDWNWLQGQVSNNDWQWLWSAGVKLGLFRHGSLISGAIKGIRELATLGRIIIATSRQPSAVQDTIDWLSFQKLPIEELHILGRNDERKASIVPRFDLAIDDSPKEIQAYVDARIPVLAFRARYNDVVSEQLPLEYQAFGWKDAVKKAREILK